MTILLVTTLVQSTTLFLVLSKGSVTGCDPNHDGRNDSELNPDLKATSTYCKR